MYLRVLIIKRKYMYLTEVNKYGLKDYACSSKVTKIHRFIISEVEKLELGFQPKDFMSLRTLQSRLKIIPYNEIKIYHFGNTEIKLLKLKEL